MTDKTELFYNLLESLDWKEINDIIGKFAKLKSLVTIGGFRLEEKNRKRTQEILGKRQPKFCKQENTMFFMAWYEKQGEIHERLEAFFKSEEYQARRRENHSELSEFALRNYFELPEEEFDRLFSIGTVEFWEMTYAFSPIVFTERQKKIIIEAVQKKEEEPQVQPTAAPQDAKPAPAALDDGKWEKEKQKLEQKCETLQYKYENERKERKELEKQLRQLKENNDQLKQDLSALRREYQSFADEARQSAQSEAERIATEVQTRVFKEATGIEYKWLVKADAAHGNAQEVLANGERVLAEQLASSRRHGTLSKLRQDCEALLALEAKLREASQDAVVVHPEMRKMLALLREEYQKIQKSIGELEKTKQPAENEAQKSPASLSFFFGDLQCILRTLPMDDKLPQALENFKAFIKQPYIAEHELLDKAQLNALEQETARRKDLWQRNFKTGEVKETEENVCISLTDFNRRQPEWKTPC